MASKQQMTGMLGVYLAAAELVRRGFIVSPTSRSALGADLLVTDQRCHNAWSVQVKTNASGANFWLIGKKAEELSSKTHMYVFVNVPKNRPPRYYIVPSKVVARNPHAGGDWSSFYRDRDGNQKYEDKWDLFGNPEGPAPDPANRKRQVPLARRQKARLRSGR
jgi:hypothetical protein